MLGILRGFKDRFVKACGVVNSKSMEGDIVMIVFKGAGGRQNNIGVLGSFIDIKINRDHKIQSGKGFIHLIAIGGGEYRVAGYGYQTANLSFALS